MKLGIMCSTSTPVKALRHQNVRNSSVLTAVVDVIFLKGLYCEECKLDKTLGVRLFSDSSDFQEIRFYHKRRDVTYLWLDCMLEQCQYYIKSKFRSKPPADKYEIDKINKGSNKGDVQQLLDSLHEIAL